MLVAPASQRTPCDAKFVAARAIAPTEQSGSNSFRLVHSECAGGFQGAGAVYFSVVGPTLIYGWFDGLALRGSKRNRPLGDVPPAA